MHGVKYLFDVLTYHTYEVSDGFDGEVFEDLDLGAAGESGDFVPHALLDHYGFVEEEYFDLIGLAVGRECDDRPTLDRFERLEAVGVLFETPYLFVPHYQVTDAPAIRLFF